MINPFKPTTFLQSAAELNQLPEDTGHEVAFIGYSNTGKSSAINTITNIKNLARTSKTPGRTQLINFFKLDNHNRLVDLPGYGYAKVAKTTSHQWQELIKNYLEIRNCLHGIILIMDIRHPLKELDNFIIHWALDYNLPVHILLTKADKLSRHEISKTLKLIETSLSFLSPQVSFPSPQMSFPSPQMSFPRRRESSTPLITTQAFSSFSHLGLDQARNKIAEFLNL